MFFRSLMYIGILFGAVAHATEPDNYTARDIILKKDNAAPIVENMINKLITAAVNETNIKNPRPEQVKSMVLESLRKRLASDSFGLLAAIAQSQSPFKVYGVPVTPLEWVLDQQNIKKYRLKRSSGPLDLVARPAIRTMLKLKWGEDFDELLKMDFPLQRYGHRVLLEESIFNKLNIFESGISGMPGIMFVASLNINSNVVGIDKLGHFFAQGYSYFESFKSGRKIQDILKDGKYEEENSFGKGIFGISTFGSGVVSYADLSANFYGLKFWKTLFDGDAPYLKVYKGNVLVSKKFNFKDYPVFSWDEAINISSFHGLAAQDIRSSIRKLGYDWNQPLDKKKALALKELNCASHFTARSLNISSDCH